MEKNELKNALKFKERHYKNEWYSCDCGSVAVLCGGSIILFDNGFGDGFFKFYVFDDEKNFNEFSKEKNLKTNFVTSCIFKDAIVLGYDCPRSTTLNMCKTDTILNDRYGIYNCNGDVFFVKW